MALIASTRRSSSRRSTRRPARRPASTNCCAPKPALRPGGLAMILDKLFLMMAEKQASDIFISAGTPIHIKIQGNTLPVNQQVMLPDMIEKIALELMSPEQAKVFETTMEMNLSFGVAQIGNFRVNIFRQRGSIS